MALVAVTLFFGFYNDPLFKNNGVMRIWISDDSLHLPIKIEQNTNIGTMVMKLKQISN